MQIFLSKKKVKKGVGFDMENNFFMQKSQLRSSLPAMSFSAYMAALGDCLAFIIPITYVASFEICITLQNSLEFILVTRGKEYCHLGFSLLPLYFSLILSLMYEKTTKKMLL